MNLRQYPRALGAVDVVVELVDFHTQLRLQNPTIFRISVPPTRWALDWSLQQGYSYDAGVQVGDPCVNGIPWPSQGMTQRQFRDGDVITVFLRTWNRVDGLCGDVSDSASDDYSGSEDAPVELHVVTLFQSGSDGDDQRFDILVPWHEPVSATLQWCIANPLVGWATPCRSFRRMPWQHQRQVFALAWTDLIEAHHVPVLFIETDVGSSRRDCHVEYIPVQLRLEDLLFWAHRTGPFELVDSWRHVHPTLPNVITFALGAQVWLRFSAPPPAPLAPGVVLLQTVARLKTSSTTPSHGIWLDPSSVVPACDLVVSDTHSSCDDLGPMWTTSTSTAVDPSSLPPYSEGDVTVDYTEANMDLSSGSSCAYATDDYLGCSSTVPTQRMWLNPSAVIPDVDLMDMNVDQGHGVLNSSSATSTTIAFEPSLLPARPVGDVTADYTEVFVDLSSGSCSACVTEEYNHVPQSLGSAPRVCYTEDNTDLSSGSSGPIGTPTFQQNELSSSLDHRLVSLHGILDTLALPWPESSICHDYKVIPALHPISALICSDQDWAPFNGQGVRYHIYTDGSALPSRVSRAAWAFHVVLESFGPHGTQFHRLGFTGALIDERTPDAHKDALDAEALALIFAADWLLSIPEVVECVLHFDALAAGCGAFGAQNEPSSTPHSRPMQHLARVALSLAQARHGSLRWRHIKAHSGQPDNEAADSVAHAIALGWTPPCCPPFGLQALFDHPLRDWAWMEYQPTAELPSLTTILTTQPQPPSYEDAMWTPMTSSLKAKVDHITWKFGTANVRTMDYHKAQYTDKLPLLRAQLQDQAFDVFAFQECRGRLDQCVDDGTFIRVCAAGLNGQAGVELWLRMQGAFAQTGFGPLSVDQLAVWHTSSTVLCVNCNHPALACTFVVIYGPQSGKPSDEIQRWWKDLSMLLRHRPRGGPLVSLGDANAHVGSVVSEGIGDLAPEIEDIAGTALRACCDELDLVLPTTFQQFHRGESHTYIGPRDAATRVDYVALPRFWLPGVEFTALCPDLDLLTNSPDHVAVQVVMTMSVQPHQTILQSRATLYDRIAAQTPEGQDQLGTLADHLTLQPWAKDVNDHWSELRQEVLQACAYNFPKRKRHQRQLYMSTTLWHLVEDRKEVVARLRGLQQTRAHRFMAGLFALWRGRFAQWHELYHEDVLADQVYAHDLRQFESLSQRFLSVRKLERKAWYSQCAHQLQDGLSRSALSQWFKLLRPKRAIRHKTHSRMPGVRTDDGQWLTRGRMLSVMWQRHFGQIENAEEGCPPFLTGENTTPEAMAQLFTVIGLPPDALGAFVEAIEQGVTIPPVDSSGHLTATVTAMLRPTWAKVPGSDSYMLPRTGSRPGDPLADTLFGFLMRVHLRPSLRGSRMRS